MSTPSIQEIVINCAEPGHLAEFWGRLLDRPWGLVSPDWAVVGADGKGPYVCFQRVPDPKGAPMNRLHLDLKVDELAEAASRAVDLGATVLGEPTVDADASGFQVLRDPEGNEFCFVTDPALSWRAKLEKSLHSSPSTTP